MDNLLATVQMQRQETSVVKWLMTELLSRASVTLNNSAGGADLVLETGTVLGQKTINTAAAATPMAADAGNTGNGVATIDAATPVLAGAQVGVYSVVCIAAAANAGVFAVYDPKGIYVGRHVVAGAAFAKQIKFAIADGAADFVVGDFFTVTVGGGDLTYVQLNATGADGSNVPAGILTARAFVTAGQNGDAVALVRFGAVIPDTLVWPNGYTASQIAAALSLLAGARNIFTLSRV